MRNNLTELLIELDACEDARIYAANFQTLKDAWDNCPRGDWMLWIYKKLKPDNLRELTLVKGHCAATVLHLMKDERSKKAVEVAVKFGEGNATRNELADAAAYAYDAAADTAYAAAAAAALEDNKKQTAEICRKYLTETLFYDK